MMSDIKDYMEKMWPLPHISKDSKETKIFVRDTKEEVVKNSGVSDNERN